MSPPPTACPACGNYEIAVGVQVGQAGELGLIGLSYKTRFLITGTEPLVADVCRTCGAVRFRVKEGAHKWVTD